MANLSNINNKFLVTTTGEVLIGQTSNNGNRLQITGADGASYIYLKTDVATTGGRIGFNGDALRVFNQQASGELQLGTAGVSRVRISNSLVVFPTITELRGDIATKFAIGNMGGASSQMMVSSRGFLTFNVSNTGSALDATERMRIDSSGNSTFAGGTIIKGNGVVYLGYTDATAIGGNKLEVNGNIYSSGNATFAGNITGVGASFIGTAASGAALVTIENNSGSTATSYGLLVKGGGNSASGKTFEVRDDSGNTDLIVKGNGNVGIGTASPSSKLDVVGANTSSIPLVELTASGTGLYQRGVRLLNGGMSAPSSIMYAVGYADSSRNMGQTYFHYAGSGSASNRLSMGLHSVDDVFNILGTGYVGIGTVSPSYKLEVSSKTRLYNVAIGGTDGGLYNVYSDSVVGFNNLHLAAQGSGAVYVNSALARPMYINPLGGNVGIGTTSATTGKLVVTGSPYVITDSGRAYGGIDLRTTTNAGNGLYSAGISFGGSSTASAAISGIQQNVDGDVQGLAFFTHGSSSSTADSAEGMRITSAGIFQVGKTDSDSNTNGFAVFPTGSGGGSLTNCYNGGSGNALRVGRNSTGGLVSFVSVTTAVGSISVTASSTSYNTSSDYRLKENVVPMEGALDRVDALKPFRFNFIADADKTVDGFLAHEVQDIVPEAISGEKDAVDEKGNPEYQGIDQSKLVPLLVAAIQELKAEIELLKSK